jgi:glycosyltransferase involved in cell wall biosynthesis
MKIAIVATPFIRVPPTGYGGTELFCYELSDELAARGHDVTIFTTGDSVVRCRKRALYPRGTWPITAADEINHVGWAFAEIARAGTFNVVHTNSPYAIPFSPLVSAPVVHTVHHRREDEFSRIYVVHPSVHYVAISRRQLELEAPLPRSRVIHHGLLPERYPPTTAQGSYLIHLGRFSAEKGTEVAIDVAQRAGLRLALAGRVHPEDRSFYALEVTPRLESGYVDVVGEADPTRKVALLREARALLCPLRWEEPFGLVAIEAMLTGTPVLGFARGSFPEIIDEGITGFCFPEGDLDGMAARARRLESFDRLRCARRARERFSRKVMVDAYEAVFERALAQAGTTEAA